MKRIARSLLTMALTLAAIPIQQALARPVELAPIGADAMTVAGGQLIWSHNEAPFGYPPYGGPYKAEIWRTGKDDAPGNQQLVYQEERAQPFYVGSVAYAQVEGVTYAYFVANYDWGITYIRRIPLFGGGAPVYTVSRTPFIDDGEMKTDGQHLYWADREGVRRMALTGGAITTLYRTATARQLVLDGNYVYFNAGQYGNAIFRVPKTGGTATQEMVVESVIRDLAVHTTGSTTTMFWAQQNGAVASRVVGSMTTGFFQSAGDRVATAVGYDGRRVIWTDCQLTEWGCKVREREDGATLTILGGPDTNYVSGIHTFVAEPNQVFWPNDTQVMRYRHTAPPTVSINPTHIFRQQTGGGGISATVSTQVSGEAPFTYQWSANNGFTATGQIGGGASIFAAMPACEERDGEVRVWAIDAIGRYATVSASVTFKTLQQPGRSCE